MAKKKKVAKKKANKKRTAWRPRGLSAKKAAIMKAVPQMPCSAIGKDRSGMRFAHTQAEKVFNRYRQEMEKVGLEMNRIEGKAYDALRPMEVYDDEGLHVIDVKAVPIVRYEGVWQIRDPETGETAIAPGAGDGDNEHWSVMSAQTNAKKQALLDFFETCWPQPTDWAKIIKQSLLEMAPDDQERALQMIVPVQLKSAVEELLAFWARDIKK